MIGIYYPYLESAGKWEELRYSLRSLEKYFREEEYEVWIIGDLPQWAHNVQYIAHKKNEKVHGSSTYDAVMKLTAYVENQESPETFIRMYDDIYFIGNRSLSDLEVTRYLFAYDEFIKSKIASGSSIWQSQVNKSIAAVKKLHHPGFMTETHCPEVFEKQKMRKIFKMFNPADNRLLTSTLYYNVFPYERMLKDRKTERALFYGKGNEFAYGKIGELRPSADGSATGRDGELAGKYFLNHNDTGLDENLKEYIMGMFPEKCRWEK